MSRGYALNASHAEQLICAVLRGELTRWPNHSDAGLVDAFMERSQYHGVQPLLYERLATTAWPTEIIQQLRELAVERTMWELRHSQVVIRVLQELARVGVEPVLFKGTALAYSLYASPALRTRSDTDLIVPLEARTRAEAVLTTLGFTREMGMEGDLVSYQAPYLRQEDDGSDHSLDLHWRINNSELLARLFTYDELLAEARPAPKLGAHALAASPVHALLLACVHRATHTHNPYYVDGVAHYGGDRMIWVFDIHLLAESFTNTQWEALLQLAAKKRLRRICRDGIKRTSAKFGTSFPDSVLRSLSATSVAEPVAVYLTGSRLRQQWMDFRAIDGLSRRLRFLGEMLFPSLGYMRHKYPRARVNWLPWLYARRAFGGIVKRMLPTRD